MTDERRGPVMNKTRSAFITTVVLIVSVGAPPMALAQQPAQGVAAGPPDGNLVLTGQPEPPPAVFKPQPGGWTNGDFTPIAFDGPIASKLPPAPSVSPLPVDMFTSKNFYKDKASWMDARYYRCRTPRQMTESRSADALSTPWGD